MTSRLQNRRDTAANWTTNNPTLAAGEIGYETDTAKFKIGTGSANWSTLGYTQNGTVTSIVAGTGLSGGTITSTGTVAIDTATTVDKTTAQTLTNKTLTAPIISTISNTGTLTLPTSTDTLVGKATSDTLTNKILTSPTVNTATNNGLSSSNIATGTVVDNIVRGLNEDVNIVASAATGTINLNVGTASVWYYTTNATANHTLNIRYSATVSLNTFMNTGDALTVVWMNTNGTTAYYPNVIQIDATTVTPKIQGGTAIAAGNASSIDVYVFTIVKTASATYTVFESQTKFA